MVLILASVRQFQTHLHGCLRLTFFTNSVIDRVYRHDNEILRGSTPVHLPYTIGYKLVETLYLNRLTSAKKRIRTPPPSPPFKVGVFVVS